jgi:hypothetical protein
LYTFRLKNFNKNDICKFIKTSKKFYDRSLNICQFNFVLWKYTNTVGPKNKIFFVYNYNGDIIARIILCAKKIIFNKKIINSFNLSDLVVDKKIPFSITKKLILLPIKILKNFFILHGSNEKSVIFYKKVFRFPNYFNLSINFFPLKITFLEKNIDIFSYFYKKIIYTFISLLCYSSKSEILFVSKNFTKKNIKYVYSTFKCNYVPQFKKNVNFYTWRYTLYDTKNLSFFYIYKNNKLIGYVILLDIIYKTKCFTILHDFNVFEKISAYESFILRINLIKQVLYRDNSIALLNFGNSFSPIFKNFLNFPFISIPKFLVPHSSLFFGRVSNVEITNIKKFHITLADIDYF